MQSLGGKMLIQRFKLIESVNAPDEGGPQNRTIERLLEQSGDDSAEPTLYFKADGTVFWVNPASLSFFGVVAGELLGQHYYEIARRFGLRFSDCPHERIEKSRCQGSSAVKYNGTWYTYRLEPVLGVEGGLRGFVSRILDIRDEVCLQEATEQLHHLMNATDNAVVIADPDHRIFRWNAGAERFFGYPADELEGKVIHDLIPPTSREVFAMYADHVMHDGGVGGMQQVSMETLTKNGEMKSVVISVAPLHDPDGIVSGIMMLARDVTGEHAGDMRLVRHMTDTAVKITGPLSHMRSNLEETVTALQDDLFTTEELVVFLTVMMKSIGLIEGNLREMNRIAIDGIDGIPDAYLKYLSQ